MPKDCINKALSRFVRQMLGVPSCNQVFLAPIRLAGLYTIRGASRTGGGLFKKKECEDPLWIPLVQLYTIDSCCFCVSASMYRFTAGCEKQGFVFLLFWRVLVFKNSGFLFFVGSTILEFLLFFSIGGLFLFVGRSNRKMMTDIFLFLFLFYLYSSFTQRSLWLLLK